MMYLVIKTLLLVIENCCEKEQDSYLNIYRCKKTRILARILTNVHDHIIGEPAITKIVFLILFCKGETI